MKYLMLAMLCMACSRPYTPPTLKVGRHYPITWKFDCSANREALEPIREAFNYWEGLGPKNLFVETSCKGRANLVVSTTNTLYNYDVNVFGRGMTDSITFYLPYLFETNSIFKTNIAKHEIAHSLWFMHSSDPECLTYRTETLDYRKRAKTLCNSELSDFKRLYATR